MKTVLMVIAVIRRGDEILLRKTDPAKNPYQEPYALFGGRLEGDGTLLDLLNRELSERWHLTVSITEKLWWDEDQKVDHDGEEKRFIYLDALCALASGEPFPANPNEELAWVSMSNLKSYTVNPPTRTLLEKPRYL